MATVLDLWQCLVHRTKKQLLEGSIHYSKEAIHFIESFAINENDLAFLCLLETERRFSFLDLENYVKGLYDANEIKESLKKLVWLGWLIILNVDSDNAVYYHSEQYNHRLQLWANKEWNDTVSGQQYGFPSEEDMAFPMTKEVYERKLEHISDDLQGIQLNYFTGSTLIDELDQEAGSLEKEKKLVQELTDLYETWKAYVPRYYPEKGKPTLS